MDALLKLRVLIWVLVIGLWGAMVYQYLGEDEAAPSVMRPINYRPVDTAPVDEVGADDLVPAWTESWALDPAVLNSDVARQLVENKRRLGVETNTRFFAARVDGEVGAYCELYSDGQTAQIENVFTLDRFRKRGLARAVVSKALEVAQGHDLIFLIADQDDWPKELYRKLGFDDVGLIWEFILPRAG